MILAQRIFKVTDQDRFASISGDCNPMHVDALSARRTQAGSPVVHGIHLLLWAVDEFAKAQPDSPPLKKLRAVFGKFVYLDETAEVTVTQQGAASARLSISVDGVPRSKFNFEFGETSLERPEWFDSALDPVPYSSTPVDLELEQMADCSGRLSFVMKREDAQACFPNATRWLGDEKVAALAASTHLIGMVCPGLHSIYSELTVKSYAHTDSQRSLAYRVAEIDTRFRSVELEIVGGGFAGTASGFGRTPPVEQATMASLLGVVDPKEFAGSVALVVGGSRGLGELTAKLISAGGGHVIVTWQSGKDDANKVAREILSAGGSCETLQYDARRPALEQLSQLAAAPTHAYYFATPTIFRPQPEIFAPQRLQEFLGFYVDGFWQLAMALRKLDPRIALFYPSTVFVEERPEGMTEYAMAKAAGEALCADMNLYLSPMQVKVSRLPRLPTDQTASVTAVETASPLDAMLPIVREVQGFSKAKLS